MGVNTEASHRIYLETLRRMSPEDRLRKAFELSDFAKELFMTGLRRRFPDLSAGELHELYLKRIDKCHNRNW